MFDSLVYLFDPRAGHTRSVCVPRVVARLLCRVWRNLDFGSWDDAHIFGRELGR